MEIMVTLAIQTGHGRVMFDGESVKVFESNEEGETVPETSLIVLWNSVSVKWQSCYPALLP